tara:strand:- start:2962 stop:5496 length:2535 start_codon:yes stop_codon:yes gene_type:complete
MPGEPNSDKLKEYKKLYKELMADELSRLEASEKINSSMDSYFQTLQDSVKAQKIIAEQLGEIESMEAKILELKSLNNDEDADTIKWMEKQVKNRRKKLEISQKNLDIQKQEASLLKSSVNWGKKKLKDLYEEHFAIMKIHSYLQESDKVMKDTAISMGLTGSRAGQLRGNMMEAASNAAVLGVSMGEIGRATQNFSAELGRSMIPSAQLMTDFAEVAKSTGLSAEEVGTFGGKLQKAGIPANQMKKTMQDLVDSSASMGLNVKEMATSLAQNIGLMNKLHFKNGEKGLIKMLEISKRFRIETGEIAALSEKIFRPEGAIELAANLQMMGGEMSRLGDPMTLMFKARNAPDELAKSFAKATAESAIFNKETGKFHFSALEMDRLRQVSEMTGLSMDSLTESSRAAARESMIAGKLGFSIDDKDKALLASASEFKDGEFKIKLPGGDMVAMKNLTRSQVDAISDNQKSLKERALEARTFDESFKDLINTLKTTFLPFLNVLNVITPYIQEFSTWVASLPEYGKWLMAGLITALGVGGKMAGMYIGMRMQAAAVSRGTTSALTSTGNIGGGGGPVPAAAGRQSGFMSQLLKISPKQLLAFGAAFILIGTGIAIAALGMAQFVKAFKGLSPEETAAAQSALLGFGIAIGILLVALTALAFAGPALAPGIVVLWAFGGAVALIGAGVGIAAAGISLLVTAIGGLDPAKLSGVGIGMLSVGAAIGILTASLVAAGILWIPALVGIAVLTGAIVALGVATQTLNTGALESISNLSGMSSDKIDKLKALFEAAAKARPLYIIHTPIIVSGTVTLDAGDVQMDLDMGMVAKKVTDVVQSQLFLTKEGTTPGVV